MQRMATPKRESDRGVGSGLPAVRNRTVLVHSLAAKCQSCCVELPRRMFRVSALDGYVLLPNKLPWTPQNGDCECRERRDDAIGARVEVRAVNRKKLPANIASGVEERSGKHALPRVVVEPDNQNARRDGAERPPSNPPGRPPRLEKRH